jgi:hypothetical protein
MRCGFANPPRPNADVTALCYRPEPEAVMKTMVADTAAVCASVAKVSFVI